jgi:hypothetical protein
MIKIRALIEKIGPGPIFGIICFLSVAIALLVSNGITFFPFIADPKVRKTLMMSLVFFLWALAGVLLLIRRGEGFIGFIFSLLAIILIVTGTYLTYLSIYSLIRGK